MEDIIDIIVTETTNTIEITAQPNDEIIDVNIIDNREDIVLNVTPTVVEININSLTGNFGVNWGDIDGTLSNQTDLQNALNLKADLVDGKVPSSQLPSYVDDIVEVATYSALPTTGETGKIYVVLDTNLIYRWSGSAYIEIKDSTAVWGAITGTLSSQTDLQSALDAKFGNPTGDTTQYIAGDGSLITFPVAGQAGTLVREVRNTSGATITKGTIVYISGATGNKPTISKAIATSDSTSAQTFGLAQADISNNSNGYVVCVGDLTGLDTSTLSEGQQLYLSSTTAGAYTTTKQTAPAHLVYIGVVTRSHPTQGQIEVKIQNGYELDEIHDVAISSVANNQGIFWESATSLWKNKSIATVLGYTPEQPLTFSSPLSRSTNTVSIPAATSSQNGYLTSTDWTTFNGKQSALSGTGFVKISGTTISYDNTSYLPLTGGTLTGTLIGTRAEFTTSTLVDGILVNNGSGRGIRIVNGGAGYGLIINNETASSAIPFVIQKSGLDKIYFTDSGAGNFTSSLTASSFVKSGGTSAQFLKADGSVDSTSYQQILTNPVTGTGTSGIVAKFNGTSTITDSIIYDNGTRVSIGADVTTSNKFTSVASTTSSYAVVAQASGAANGFWATLSGTGEIFRGQTSGGSYFIINNGGDAFLNGNLNVGDFASTSYKLKVNGTANFTGALSGTSATFSSSVTTQSHVFLNNGALNFGGTGSASSTDPAIYRVGSGVNDLAIAIGSSERFRITSSGNVGIGTTAPTSLFHIASTTTLRSRLYTSSGASFMDIENAGNSFYVGVDDSSGSTFGGSAYARTFYGTGAYPMVFWTNNTERMRITSGGNVGIGLTNPQTQFHINGVMTFSEAGFDTVRLHKIVHGHSDGNSANNYIAFQVSDGSGSTAERMRINGNGDVMINGTTINQSASLGFGKDGAGIYQYINRSVTSGAYHIEFRNPNGLVGSISTSGTITSFNITSDYRLKQDLKPIKGLEIVNKIKVYDYEWIADGTRMDGVLAHELQEVLPYAVMGVKDGEQMQSVDYSKIVPVMVQAIKDLKTELDILKNK